MTLADRLARLAAGERPVGDWLLGSCALTTASGDAYGEEAIVAAFAAAPATLAAVVDTPRGTALFGTGAALFADVYNGHVARLWRVGGAGLPPARRVDVAFDPDLAQPRGDVFVDPAAGLDAAAAERLTAAVLPLVRTADDNVFRRRAFVVRTLAVDARVAALVALYTASPAGIGFRYAAVSLAGDDVTVVADGPLDPSWTPRL